MVSLNLQYVRVQNTLHLRYSKSNYSYQTEQLPFQSSDTWILNIGPLPHKKNVDIYNFFIRMRWRAYHFGRKEYKCDFINIDHKLGHIFKSLHILPPNPLLAILRKNYWVTLGTVNSFVSFYVETNTWKWHFLCKELKTNRIPVVQADKAANIYYIDCNLYYYPF